MRKICPRLKYPKAGSNFSYFPDAQKLPLPSPRHLQEIPGAKEPRLSKASTPEGRRGPASPLTLKLFGKKQPHPTVLSAQPQLNPTEELEAIGDVGSGEAASTRPSRPASSLKGDTGGAWGLEEQQVMTKFYLLNQNCKESATEQNQLPRAQS